MSGNSITSPVERTQRAVDTTDSFGDPILELADVGKEFGDERAVDGISVDVREGELLTLLGPSGCGKTTTLRMVAGLETPTEGTITIDGERVAGAGTATAPENRDVGLVFQEYALFPHLSVAENIAFGLEGHSSAEEDARVEELLELVDLAGYGDRKPESLSGGERQRVALARSLAPEPDVLLLDEPFSNLDVRLRVEMREEVRRILKEAGVTAVSVTHDQEEALSISDRVAIMNDGRIEQVGSPEEVFGHPESRFVASFLGQASFLSGTVVDGGVDTPLGMLDDAQLDGSIDAYRGADIDVLVRPDDLAARPSPGTSDDGEIVHRTYTGPSFVYRVALDAGDVVHCQHNHATEFDHGTRVEVAIEADHSLAWYPAE
ncbi:ATP-binding cassette domain-containing protein [Halapricum sp. CBA1109]|uniref:ABC transporter ATP-binding protein n=1 Tax=Halapricum sp. CBA1109 TaxID=2668068 RepID=UPI0012F936A6|nr:ABC transporter ATP-binding protein [Halapricum sp. CBA1109]MUV90450.1 ATP-binding cassette domain-containing protein [Halapricum sp. CBA1109]